MSADKAATGKMEDADVVRWIISCREEADSAKADRMQRNKENFDMFHLRQDFSHKEEGQSTEVLSKQAMAVESTKSFFQQALTDVGDWWSAEAKFPDNEQSLPIRAHEITAVTNYMLGKAKYFSHVGNTVELALLGSLGISRVGGKMVPKPKYISRKKGRGAALKRWVEKVNDEVWELAFKTLRQEDYYPDPTGAGLYEIEEEFVDAYEMIELSEGDDAIYDPAVVKLVPLGMQVDEQEGKKAREVGQNTTLDAHRPKVKLTHFYGTILNKTTGVCEYENCVATIANESYLIRPPEPNPLWHQLSPVTASPLMEVANSVWHKAQMDAPTMSNRMINEIFNLMVDAAFQQVHAISQIRKEALDDPASVTDGIKPGATLAVNSMLPVGAKVLEPLTAVTIPNEAFNMFNIMGNEFNSSALTSDLRTGGQSIRAVKATEVVEQSQSITSVFQGMAKNFEVSQITRELELAWMTTAQNWDKIDKSVFTALFGPQRGEQLSQLAPEDVFVHTVDGFHFKVFGVTMKLAKTQDFRKYTQLSQIVWGNPAMLEEFTKKYDAGKFLGEIMTALDIDKQKIELPKPVQMTMQSPPDQGAPPPGAPGQPPGQGGTPQGPDTNSQIPQAGSQANAGNPATAQAMQMAGPGGPQ